MRTEDDLRAALQSLERHAPDLAAVLPAVAIPGAARPRRPAQRRWLRLWGPPVAALAVVAAILTPVTVGKIFRAGIPNGPAHSSPRPVAAVVLNALAQAAAAQPAQTGKYLRVSSFVGSLGMWGPNAHPFLLDERSSLSTTWYPTSSGAKPVAYQSTEQTSALPTAGAAAAWRADGKPALLHQPGKVTSFPDPAGFPGGDIGLPYFGGETLTNAQYLALPTGTATLRAAIEHAAQTMPAPSSWVPGEVKQNQSQKMFEVCLALLDHDPVTSAVRAAALRVLATLPGIQYEGTLTDSLGREGAAFSMVPAITSMRWGASWGHAVPIGSDEKTLSRLRIVISSSGALLDEQYVTTSPTNPGLTTIPSSGAIPGRTSCPAGWYQYKKEGVCIRDGDVVVSLGGDQWKITGPHGGPARTGLPLPLSLPAAVYPAGTVEAYQAFLGSSWTNETPSAAGSAQHIPAR